MNVILIAENHEQASAAHTAVLLSERHGLPSQACELGDLADSIATACAKGSTHVALVPLFVGVAHPAHGDIAGIVTWAQSTWPGRRISAVPAFGDADVLATLLVRRAEKSQDALIIVGAGSDEAMVNAEIALLARLVCERRATPTEIAFVAHALPDVATMLSRCHTLGIRQVQVVPLVLFESQTYQRLAQQVEHARLCQPRMAITLAPPLLDPASAAFVVAQRLSAQNTPTEHGHSHPTTSSMLPPRYQGVTVSAAPMGATDLQFGTDGRVAWDEMWADFCDLALAGGPPHRSMLLEPVRPETVRANPQAQARVLEELARGIGMVSGLAVVTDAAEGWIGVRCDDQDMALWMLRAIVVENICVRREEATLFLPAGPDFRLEHEIKNIVTVAAKTFHYWTEHRREMVAQ